MERAELIYASLLMLSVPLGFLVRLLSSSTHRQLVSSGVGVAMVTIVCGWEGLHAAFTTLVNSFIVAFFSPRICHRVSFAWCFSYIVFFCLTQYVNLAQVDPHTNGIQLLLTLRLVGLAFEVHDTHVMKETAKKDDFDEKSRLECEFKGIEPTFMGMLLYSSNYVGLLTVTFWHVLLGLGPYYRYRTYQDMLKNDYGAKLTFASHIIQRMKWIPVFGTAYYALSLYVSVQYVRSDEFYENPFWFRLFYMTPMFMLFRFRMYFALLTSEIVCMAVGMGAYPTVSQPKIGQGPTDLRQLKKCSQMDPILLDYDFETVRCIDTWGVDFSPNVRTTMRCWNMSVQFWLASHVYHRFPLKLRAIRTTVTLAVSAFWHGIHPGYYLCFLTVPPAILAEEAMAAAFRSEHNLQLQWIYDLWSTFWKCRFLDYMAMAFLLLSWQDTLRYWASIYFLPHIVIVVFIIVGNIFKPKHSRFKGPSEPSTTGGKIKAQG